MLRSHRVAWACCAALAWHIAAHAQSEFPTRPVRLVNPYSPGGSVDLVAALSFINITLVAIGLGIALRFGVKLNH